MRRRAPKVFRAWTDPELLKQWFAPLPYTTPVAELDVRPGGASSGRHAQPPRAKTCRTGAVYLEVVENERLVFTDRLHQGVGALSQKPFMTVILTFENEGGKTRYTARVRPLDGRRPRDAQKDGLSTGGWGLCHRPTRGPSSPNSDAGGYGAKPRGRAPFGSSQRRPGDSRRNGACSWLLPPQSALQDKFDRRSPAGVARSFGRKCSRQGVERQALWICIAD